MGRGHLCAASRAAKSIEKGAARLLETGAREVGAALAQSEGGASPSAAGAVRLDERYLGCKGALVG